MYKRSERDKYIRDAYAKAPNHLKGRVVQKLQDETELSKARIYSIVKKQD
jgi:hypothetical protein